MHLRTICPICEQRAVAFCSQERMHICGTPGCLFRAFPPNYAPAKAPPGHTPRRGRASRTYANIVGEPVPVVHDLAPELTAAQRKPCPWCQAPMVVKCTLVGKRPFWGCARFPICRGSAKIDRAKFNAWRKKLAGTMT